MEYKIVEMKPSEIKPYENNPRYNAEAVDYVANSIKAFGFVNPIVIDKDNVIVCGHTRWLASKKLRLKQVPVIVVDNLTEKQVKGFRIIDNKTSEIAEWDEQLLAKIIPDIAEYDLQEFGFLEDYLTAVANELADEYLEQPEVEKTEFGLTLTFPIEFKYDLQEYIRENGKSSIAEAIVTEVNRNA